MGPTFDIDARPVPEQRVVACVGVDVEMAAEALEHLRRSARRGRPGESVRHLAVAGDERPDAAFRGPTVSVRRTAPAAGHADCDARGGARAIRSG